MADSDSTPTTPKDAATAADNNNITRGGFGRFSKSKEFRKARDALKKVTGGSGTGSGASGNGDKHNADNTKSLNAETTPDSTDVAEDARRMEAEENLWSRFVSDGVVEFQERLVCLQANHKCTYKKYNNHSKPKMFFLGFYIS